MKTKKNTRKYIVASLLLYICCIHIGAQTANNCYAVLINGGYDQPDNYEHFYKDLQEVYKTLTDHYNYNESNIYVLNADGTGSFADMNSSSGQISSDPDLDGDGDADINYSATEDNIQTVFTSLSYNLDSDDFLFIFITGPTEINYRSDLVLWHERMELSDLADEIDQVDAGEICIVNSASFGGTMMGYLDGSNRVLSSATEYNQSLHVTPNVYGNGVFISNWIAGVRGETISGQTQVDADYDKNGHVSMDEAFTYADLVTNTDEDPQYASDKYTLGENLTLNGKEICVSTDYYHDKTVSSGETTTITDCGIDIENVLVEYGGRLVLEAENYIIIHSDFEVSGTLLLE